MAIPIKFHELLQLTNVGVNYASINFKNVTMESDKFIVCKDKSGDSAQVVIIDIGDPSVQMRRPSDADAVIMHPRQKIVALRFGKKLQIFDLDKKEMIKDHSLDEDVVFWTWIDEETIGAVTESAVYHWALASNSSPVKAFDRHPTMNGCQIINYRADADRKWLVLIGIAAKGNRIAGSMQLYSMQRSISQPIEGHAACFIRFKLDGNPHPSNLLVFSVRGEQGGKTVIVELGNPAAGNRPYQKKGVDVPYPAEIAGDFPISMQASPQQGVVYLITKNGFLHIFDVDSGSILYSNRISGESIFITTEYLQGGFLGINRKGQVLSVALDEQEMIEHVRQTNPELSRTLARRWAQQFSLSTSVVYGSVSVDVDDGRYSDYDSIYSPANSASSPLPPPSSLLYGRQYTPSPRHYTPPPPTPPQLIPSYEPIHIEVNDRIESRQLDDVASRYHELSIDNMESSERAERAEAERDQIAARYQSLSSINADLAARADRAERERDEIAVRLAKLEKKCREVMMILGGDMNESTVQSTAQSVQPKELWVIDSKQSSIVNKADAFIDLLAQGGTNYSSLMDD
ncbi:hypothetical protein PRIPAC_93030 [Pristionchus pacificus]|nr:hypothetical protein PRIPAC_93030 [Pristionchus pacificus]